MTFDKVRDIVVEQLGVEADEVALESTFIDDLGDDSLDIVELIMAFEEEFGAAIPEEAAEKLTTVGKVIEYLKSKGYGDDEAAAPAQ
jgi:acyl carrier protein